MFLRRCIRQKNGKPHTYWALVESYRTARGSRQRLVAYVGELKKSEESGWAQAAMDLAEGQTHRLTQRAGILAEADAQENLVQEIQNRIVDLLTAQCGDPRAPASCFATLGWIHEKRHNTDLAVPCFREALARDYGQVNYPLALARLLAHAGEWEEAMREAKVCLRLSPQYGPAEKLIEESSVRLTLLADKADPEETGSK